MPVSGDETKSAAEYLHAHLNTYCARWRRTSPPAHGTGGTLHRIQNWSWEQLQQETSLDETLCAEPPDPATVRLNEQTSAIPLSTSIDRQMGFSEARPLLITGAEGTLGYAFSRLCHQRYIPHVALARRDMDITDVASVESNLERYCPWAVINAAGYMDLDRAEHDEEACYQANTAGPALLAAECKRLNIPLLTFSSDLVFNGRQATPYLERDSPTPVNIYGRSKGKAEALVREILPNALIVRTGALFSPWNSCNFITSALSALAAGNPFVAVNDAIVSPTYVPDLVQACLKLLFDGESGLWHLANVGAVTWEQWGRMAAERAGIATTTLESRATCALHLAARRPLYTVLGTERGQILQTLDAALDCYLRDCGVDWSARRATLPHQATTLVQHSVTTPV